MQRKSIFSVFIILALTFLACGGSETSSTGADSESDSGKDGVSFSVNFSTAAIESAQLAFDFDLETNEPIEPTDVFYTEDTEFHSVVKLSSAPDGTKLKIVWISVDSEYGQNKQITEATQEIKDGTYSPDMVMSVESGLPVGSYKADLYLDDKLERTLEFTVEEG